MMRRPALLGVALLAIAAPAAADVSNLEAGLPVEITDAEPMPSGEKEVQLQTRWDSERGGTDRLVMEPQFQWGFARRWQGSVILRGIFGSTDRTASGDVRVEMLRKLNDERGWLPAFAAALRLDVPTGRNTRGLDSTLLVIASHGVGTRPGTHRVHLNAGWTRNARAMPEERPDRARLLAGYSTLLDDRTVLVADLVRQHERDRGSMSSIAEVGVRRELAHATLVSLGVGAGRGGPGTPRWRVIAGIEHEF